MIHAFFGPRHHLRVIFAAAALAVVASLAAVTEVSAREWRPARLTILLGDTAEGIDGTLTRALAAAWSQALGTRVVVDARGRNDALDAADAFTHSPHDGTVVLAGDLGDLALAYAHEHPLWNWARTLEHFGVFALDPAVLLTGTSSGIRNLDAVAAAARVHGYQVGVTRWRSVDNLVLSDVAAQVGLRWHAVPAGSGASLVRALTDGKLPLAFGRLSDLAVAGRHVAVLAVARPIDGPPLVQARTLDAVLGTRTAPAGRIDVISVHADFQRIFPARYDILKRSLAIALDDPGYRKTVSRLRLTLAGVDDVDHGMLLATVRRWWDEISRVGAVLDLPPAPTATRGKITALGEGGRRIRYLGLDGRTHELRIDPDNTALVVNGDAVTGARPLRALKVGMLCRIAWPSAIAVEASRLNCR